MVKIAILNLYLHQLEKADIEFHNPLTTGKGSPYPGLTYDVILANPPFSGAIQKESILADINLPTRDTEKLFLKWFVDHLVPGGKAGVIVPNGVLFGSDKASRKLRATLLEDCDLQAVITLPSGVFKPYAGVATAVLVFEKGRKTEYVWFYELRADGFTLSDTRTPIDDNDIPDLLGKWPKRETGDNAFRVSAPEIVAKNFELLPRRYKLQTIVLEQHDAPKKIIDEILGVEKQIENKLEMLRRNLQ
jgi:type I restriction enzyme M protein